MTPDGRAVLLDGELPGRSLLGGLVQFGWEKAFGGYDKELSWWEDRAVEGARLL